MLLKRFFEVLFGQELFAIAIGIHKALFYLAFFHNKRGTFKEVFKTFKCQRGIGVIKFAKVELAGKALKANKKAFKRANIRRCLRNKRVARSLVALNCGAVFCVKAHVPHGNAVHRNKIAVRTQRIFNIVKAYKQRQRQTNLLDGLHWYNAVPPARILVFCFDNICKIAFVAHYFVAHYV